MVLPANSQSAQAALHGVRVEGDAGITQEPLESLPVPQRIADRLAARRARQDRPRLDRVQRADLLDQRRGLRVMRLRLDEAAARVGPTEGERERRRAVAALR